MLSSAPPPYLYVGPFKDFLLFGDGFYRELQFVKPLKIFYGNFGVLQG